MNIRNKKREIAYFITFIVLYLLLDYLNMPYSEMKRKYGVHLVIINISMNLIIAYLSMKMLINSEKLWQSFKMKSKGESLSYISILFGIFTYGCTPCVISFLGSIGISFAIVTLPYQGLPYKLISLILVIIGYLWTQKESQRTSCNVKYKKGLE